MKTKNIFYAGLCALFMLTSAMCCDDDDSEGIIELTGIKLNQYNNTGAYPVIIENGQCPKEAYLIRISPILETYYSTNILKSPIIAFRIITLTDFNEDYPAGSDIYKLFKEYPPMLLSENFREHYLSSDCLDKGQPITTITWGDFYKVLLTYPQPGNYQFRIELETEDGNILSEETEVILY